MFFKEEFGKVLPQIFNYLQKHSLARKGRDFHEYNCPGNGSDIILEVEQPLADYMQSKSPGPPEFFFALRKKMWLEENNKTFRTLNEKAIRTDLDTVARSNIVLVPAELLEGIEDLIDLYFYGEDTVIPYFHPEETNTKYVYGLSRPYTMVTCGKWKSGWEIIEDPTSFNRHTIGLLLCSKFSIKFSPGSKIFCSEVEVCS